MLFRTLIIATIAAVGLLATPECRAQFVDTFDGNALAPHWEIISSPGALQHHVSGGLLHVTDLPLPSHPKSPTNFGGIQTSFAPVSGDFYARAVVGWDSGELRELDWSLSTTQGLVGTMRYFEGHPLGPRIAVGASGLVHFAAPPSGIHEFVLRRQGSLMSAYLDGALLRTFAADTLTPLISASLVFEVAYPNDGMQPMYVDLIQIVPSPGTAVMLALGFTACKARRRRPCRDSGKRRY